MHLQSLTLSHFRNYTKSTFHFTHKRTVLIGPNGIGKSNFIESLFLLATGKSFRAENEKQLIQFEETACRVWGKIIDETEQSLEIIFADQGTAFLKKKYLVNGVAKRRVDFAGRLTAVLFTPSDLELVSGQPGNRRRFLDDVLEQVDMEYRLAHTIYTKALRQRNALLSLVQETGRRNEKVFAYWDELLIKNGSILTQKREAFINFINERQKDFFPCVLTYDKSLISEDRLAQYKTAEVGAGVTLVGPHRDDVLIQSFHKDSKMDVRYFASRGQQRLVTLELKLAQMAYLAEQTHKQPILLLDDIFSELDSKNIQRILALLSDHQVIITTTHKEFVADIGLTDEEMIELSNYGEV
ncbi:MAG TPA: DNA replication and repair protein RecF [Methylomirabilota bacterium]|nr:DNA replication and repair protein RecF [Methylomirabilota bacterium]